MILFFRRLIQVSALATALAGCRHLADLEPPPFPLPTVAGSAGTAAPRVSGSVGEQATPLAAQLSTSTPASVSLARPGTSAGGDISFDFADTDIREITAQILGNTLHVNYAIDPAVRGTATMRTAAPVNRAQALSILQALLAQNAASLVQSGDTYRVVPNAAAAASPGLARDPAAAGTALVPLRYASAEDLAKTLQPYAQNGARIVADASSNALVLTGDAAGREALTALVQAFDVDVLAGQSYALLPVESGDVGDFATALQTAFRARENQPLANVVRVVPMTRINSVLVVSAQPRYVQDARRVYDLVQRARRQTLRTWHVYYLQNSHANDIAYVLQQAFTPNNVTAQPTSATQTGQNGLNQLGTSGGGGFGSGHGGSSGGGFGGSGGGFGGSSSGGGFGGGQSGGGQSGGAAGGGLLGGGQGGGLGAGGQGGAGGTVAAGPAASAAPAANPLLGGLDASAGGGGTDLTATMRIIPNEQNNAVLIYGTRNEEQSVEAVLRKIDILPLQVRIDATIAEVTLNDQLQYGTQWFFKSGGINGVLNFASQTVVNPAGAVLNATFPGFLIGGKNAGGAPFALNALQAVTTVHVLSSPQLLVLDNQPARLQVGDVVPYLSQTSQSTVSSNAPVVSSINYQQTGVIMQVTPRVNSGGLVTLDIAQDVSEVAQGVTTEGINSPTFQERNVTSRVVVQDGQTIGLAGLIRDSVSRTNEGIPWLKDIPLLGLLAGEQRNVRGRTELLILITPHVLHDQRDARALTEDLRDQLPSAAGVPDELQGLRASGSADPSARLRRALRLQQ